MNTNLKKTKKGKVKSPNQVIKLENLSDLVDKNLNPKKLFFNTTEAARLLSVTSRTLLNWRNEGVIDFIQIKHVILYKWDHIQDFAKRNELSMHKK